MGEVVCFRVAIDTPVISVYVSVPSVHTMSIDSIVSAPCSILYQKYQHHQGIVRGTRTFKSESIALIPTGLNGSCDTLTSSIKY